MANDMARRSKNEIGKALVKYIEDQQEAFYKTNLEEIGMNSKTAEEWLELYILFQNGPKVRKITTKNNVIYEKLVI